MADGPLAGVRIVVTRAREQAEPLAGHLARLGAEVAVVPLIEIRATALPPLDLDGLDWLVVTSANGVAACARLLRSAPATASPRLAVVGPATAAAARAEGLEPAFVPERFAADAIAAGLEPLEGARVLVAQGDLADGALADELRSRRASVQSVVAYRTLLVRPSAAGRADLDRADVVIVASGSAARSLAEAGGVREAVTIACIGPKTAAVAAGVGLRVGLVADEATADGIIRALVTHFPETR